METDDTVFKVGIIGPRPFSYGDHDTNCGIRTFTKNVIKKILKKHQRNYGTVIGITGLGLGAEQDFAEACTELNIGYSGFLAYPNLEATLRKLPGQQEKYKNLKDNSLGIKEVSKTPLFT
jgi:hypothetical protein